MHSRRWRAPPIVFTALGSQTSSGLSARWAHLLEDRSGDAADLAKFC